MNRQEITAIKQEISSQLQVEGADVATLILCSIGIGIIEELKEANDNHAEQRATDKRERDKDRILRGKRA